MSVKPLDDLIKPLGQLKVSDLKENAEFKKINLGRNLKMNQI